MHMVRPFGITIAAIIVALLGIGSIIVGLLGMGVFKLAGVDTSTVANASAIGLTAVVVGVVQIVVSWSLWTLKGWAWLLAVVLQGINVVVGIASIVMHGMSSMGSAAIGSLVVSAIILAYFMTGRVRAAFHR
jgi:uncharacterized membrane protein (DUF2068 family)